MVLTRTVGFSKGGILNEMLNLYGRGLCLHGNGVGEILSYVKSTKYGLSYTEFISFTET